MIFSSIELNKTSLEVIIANGFETSALKLLKSKKNVRIIDSTNFNFDDVLQINSVSNSMLIQSQDDLVFKKKISKLFQRKNQTKYNLKIYYLHSIFHVMLNPMLLCSLVIKQQLVSDLDNLVGLIAVKLQ